MTPPLGQAGYVFPVAERPATATPTAPSAATSTASGTTATDIFASLGTPVVAVASGTVNRVGWRKAGGWRVWVRDRSANQFYYAHLSGYASTLFHSRYVEAGEVIGFVGNTGDASPAWRTSTSRSIRISSSGSSTTERSTRPVPGTLGARPARTRSPRPKHPKLIMRVAARREARPSSGGCSSHAG